MTPRFLQIHTLTPYTAALINRDDSGLAKRLPYGGVLRTRISSQCLKRHWRIADDPHALQHIDGAERAFRSRELVTKLVIDPLRDDVSKNVVDTMESAFQTAVYGDKGTKRDSRQTLLFGEPEIKWLAEQAKRLAEQANGDAKAAETGVSHWKKDFQANIKAMRAAAALPAGLVSALFGRMVTSDTDANIAAPVHVAHAFTVHEEESESDYFTAVDDLSGDDPGRGYDSGDRAYLGIVLWLRGDRHPRTARQPQVRHPTRKRRPAPPGLSHHGDHPRRQARFHGPLRTRVIPSPRGRRPTAAQPGRSLPHPLHASTRQRCQRAHLPLERAR